MGGVPPLIRPIRKLLIANRGEIALRIMRTARSLGIATVAVSPDADERSPHVGAADESARIDSYLNAEAIVAAARRAGADAVHPGYGFLAESADFAAACGEAGLVFVGPTPDVISLLARKTSARAIANQAGVPVVPMGSQLPMLIKAAAGGGGRGMRIVRRVEDVDSAMDSARGEAERAFGDGTLLMERYIEGARHVEVQIFGDHYGDVIHLFERDCSVQRRHQKIIEESPSPAVTADLRARMCDAAVTLGKAMGYTNAGTVEFLLAPSGEFYFIEVNTRIQVEHPVTEMITGLDLIRLQIEVAEGRALNLAGVEQRGHAIEARLYAEQPENGFLPSTGTVHVWEPGACARIDSGIARGTEVTRLYDPLLAKFVAWAEDRDTAIRKLTYALRSTAVGGVETNRDFLIQVLEHEDFREGRAHTSWSLDYARDGSRDEMLADAAADYIVRERHTSLPGVPAYWRNNPARDPVVKLEIAGTVHECRADATQNCSVWAMGGAYYVHSTAGAATVRVVPRFPEAAPSSKHETANSPMPGQVLRILVEQGQPVKPGDALVVLEAMKMEQTIRAKIGGRVAAILVKQGQVVAPGQMLVEIDSRENADD